MKRVFLMIAAAFCLLTSAGRADEAAVKALLEGVSEIAAPGIPGGIAAYGPQAFPVVTAKSGQSQIPVVAAAEAGNGRVVLFGHDGYFNEDALNYADTGKLMLNALRWAAKGKARVGVFKRNETLKWLGEKGVQARATEISNPGVDVLIVNGHDINNTHINALSAYLKNGGGLIMATTGWGWEQTHPNQTLANDFEGNKITAPLGLVWTDAMLGKTTKGGIAATAPTPLSHAGRAFDAIMAHIGNGAQLGKEDLAQASAVVSGLATALPPDDAQLLPRLRKLATDATGEVVPLPRRPIKAEDGAARLLLTLQTAIEKTLPVDQVQPHPAGAIFPGDVPPNYKPVTQTVPVDLTIPDWHGVGLYAAPGGKVKITLPAGAEKLGLGVRIGCHTDTLYHLDSWTRAPDISRAWPLQDKETTVANPFGGLVYITVPGNKTGNTDVTIGGAYEAPRFVLGQTDVNDWQNRIRWLPGPWAEIETERAIVTVPSRSIRDLDDPRPVAQLYQDALVAMSDLRGIKKLNPRPERIVADQQISAGYMHSGYPVMTWLDVEKTSAQNAALRNSSWGHWHEFGHNHQVGDWTPEGTGEVTNNLFALYVWEKIIGKERALAHPAVRPDNMKKAWDKYVAGGKKYSDLQKDPFLYLQMYIQLQDAFGWDTYKKVFAEYRDLKPNERPKSNEDKLDQWMVRFSRAAGKNLGPFFQAWGVPVSPQALNSIKNLPVWIPDSVK